MPWCDECDQLVEDEELSEDGECPTCGTVLGGAGAPPGALVLQVHAGRFVIYLGYRAYQGITWVVHHV